MCKILAREEWLQLRKQGIGLLSRMNGRIGVSLYRWTMY